MTLAQLITIIEGVAGSQPSVRSVIRNDVFRLNANPDANYGVFAWLQGNHTDSLDTGMVTYSFTFFYVDRLTFDRSNEVEVQSVGIQTLHNICKTLDSKGVYVATDISYQTFNQRFTDECAGVYCSVSLEVPIDSLCEEEFKDYSSDFSSDFTIY